MGDHYDLDPRDRKALVFLWELATTGGGYARRRVRGWAMRDEIELKTKLRYTERLPRLAGRRLLDRADVRAPGFSKPVWIYRITADGVRALRPPGGAPEDLAPAAPEDGPEDTAVFIPEESWSALGELRRAWHSGRESPHLKGERGWCSLRELMARVFPDGEAPQGFRERTGEEWKPRGYSRDDSWSKPPDYSVRDVFGMMLDDLEASGWDPLLGGMPGYGDDEDEDDEEEAVFYMPADIEWLVRAGLAQRWGVVLPGRAKPQLLFRATPAGLAAVRIDRA